MQPNVDKKRALLPLTIALVVTIGCEKSVEEHSRIVTARIVWSVQKPHGYSDLVQPVIENGKAYVASDTTLGCYDITDGTILWKKDLNTSRSVASSKLLHAGDHLFLNHSTWVRAFNKLTGQIAWETPLDGFQAIDLEAMSQNSTHLYLGGSGEVLKIEKVSGTIVRRFPLSQLLPTQQYTQSGFNPVVSLTDDMLYVPASYATPNGLAGNLLCYNSDTGEYLWGYSVSEMNGQFDITSCAIQDSVIIFPSGKHVIALNRFTGTLLWDTIVPNDAFWEWPMISGERVYIGSTALARMYCFDLRTGAQLWRSVDTRQSITTMISMVDGRLYFCNGAILWVLAASTGVEVWNGLPPEYNSDQTAIYQSPVAVGEGYMVCVGSKKVYCLTIPQ